MRDELPLGTSDRFHFGQSAWMRTTGSIGLLATLVLASASCGGSSGAESERSCPAPTDRAPRRGECTLVDWDATSATGNVVALEYYVNEPGCSLALNRIEVDETSADVTLRVIVGFTGDEGASCPTAFASRMTTAMLDAPLGARRLLGCRPTGSFVPAGGYNEPAARDAVADCTPGD